MTVEDAVSAQFAEDIPAFAKPTFERFRRTRHSAQYFDPKATPITRPDASWRLKRQRLPCPEREHCWLTRRLIGSLPIRQIEPEHGTADDCIVESAGS